MNLSSLRRSTYRLGSILGDVSAARRGPSAYGRRIARKSVYRAQGRATRSVLRQIGLGK